MDQNESFLMRVIESWKGCFVRGWTLVDKVYLIPVKAPEGNGGALKHFIV